MTGAGRSWDHHRIDLAAARARLGVTPHATWDEVRRAYRRRVQATHPDRATGTADAAVRTRTTAELSLAYATLAAHHRRARTDPAGPGASGDAPPLGPGPVLHLGLAPTDALLALLEAAHGLGDVSYVDRGSGVLEVIVTDAPGQATSLLILVEPDGTGSRAEMGVEPLGRHAPADLTRLAARLAELLGGPA